MATKKLASIKGRRMRLTRLDECGVPVIGSCSSIVTEGFIQVDVEEEYEDGEEISQKNAWGDYCIQDVGDDLVKWVNVSVNMCQVDPDALDVMARNATPVTSGSDTIGATFGRALASSAFALEVWTKAAGQDACAGGTTEWGYIVVPYIRNGRLSGALSVANNALTVPIQGKGFPAPADWGITPYEDNPLLLTGGFPEGDMWGIVRTTVQPPTATAGCVAIAEP